MNRMHLAEAGTLITAHVLDGWKQPEDTALSLQHRAVGLCV